nr:MAG TPA: hypothetical protein [Caudoviricetes sp.]
MADLSFSIAVKNGVPHINSGLIYSAAAFTAERIEYSAAEYARAQSKIAAHSAEIKAGELNALPEYAPDLSDFETFYCLESPAFL